MGKRDPRVDAYIAKSAEFAKPILQHLREVVHGACPEAEETVKWGMPHFLHEGILCHMAAFKAHCAFGFYKSALLFDDTPKQKEAMGDMGRITSVADLPPKKELVRLVRAARRLNEERIAAPRTKTGPKPPVELPGDFAAALVANAKARATFAALPPSHRREYAEWITGAKQDATRQRRLAQAIAWLEEGKSRNWKYERC
ncbi:MAG: YdeI/OmpD-associated family protein [Holophagales bacterium]|nr:YdeI/OmpD-associated family protein [Holophagales bacterium]MBK9375575.1 YdeI/OmpD-associated family protein [Holophagales bacterium]